MIKLYISGRFVYPDNMNRDESVRTNKGALQILYTLSSRVNIQYFEKNKISYYQIICQNELLLLFFFFTQNCF